MISEGGEREGAFENRMDNEFNSKGQLNSEVGRDDQAWNKVR